MMDAYSHFLLAIIMQLWVLYTSIAQTIMLICCQAGAVQIPISLELKISVVNTSTSNSRYTCKRGSFQNLKEALPLYLC